MVLFDKTINNKHVFPISLCSEGVYTLLENKNGKNLQKLKYYAWGYLKTY